jgi:hypothetical protein
MLIYIDLNTCEIEGTSPSLMSRHFHVGPLERIPDILYLLIERIYHLFYWHWIMLM